MKKNVLLGNLHAEFPNSFEKVTKLDIMLVSIYENVVNLDSEEKYVLCFEEHHLDTIKDGITIAEFNIRFAKALDVVGLTYREWNEHFIID